MKHHFARLAALAAFALTATACSGGNGTALPFAGTPNNAGGSSGTYQPGGTSTALLRFVEGSPDYASADVCIDQTPLLVTTPSVSYGSASTSLYAVGGGISHTVAVYPALGAFAGPAGSECATAPGPYFGTSAIAVTTIAPGVNGNAARETIVLGGTAATHTLGLYVYGEPSFVSAPAGAEAISQNAAPAFSATTPLKSVGFGDVAGGVPATLTGASSVAAPVVSAVSAAVVNPAVTSALAAAPTSFYDGIGIATGTVVPLTTVAAPSATPYVVELYGIDGPANHLNLVAVAEQVTGYGF